MIRIYGLLLCYYLIGIIAIAVINRRRRDVSVRDRWTKLVVYLIITSVFTSLLFFAPYIAIALSALIVVVGFFEIFLLPQLTGVKKLLVIAGYTVIGILFCLFVSLSLVGVVPSVVYMLVLTFDGFSQIFGQLIGGKRIAPSISPGKTYAGLFGGLLMGVLTLAFLKGAFTPATATSALIVCLLAFTGDMLASAIKRAAHVKDYSSLIPGHGGVLDRFDSFIFVGALLALYFRLI